MGFEEMKTTRITVGRVYNLGNYENVRLEISVELSDGDSARDALIGLEKIIAALAPERQQCVHTRRDLERAQRHLDELRDALAKNGPDNFKRDHGYFEGTPEEYLARCSGIHADNVAKREKYERRADMARRLLDNLGGAATWRDAKLDWETDDWDE